MAIQAKYSSLILHSRKDFNMWKFVYALFFSLNLLAQSANQTEELSPISTSTDSLPFQISIVQASFQLPSDELNSFGLQSFIWGNDKNKVLLLCGRTNGVHGFSNTDDNFPIRLQNTTAYVIDSIQKSVTTRSLADPSSHLSQSQIDHLSVTAPQYFQVGNTLYLVGGYGVDSSTTLLDTKSALTAIDIPTMISWVEGSPKHSAAAAIRQTWHPLLQVTGGFLCRASPHQPFLLIMGQNFSGYYRTSSNGSYTQQIRPFRIIDNGTDLYIKSEKQFPSDPNYRRRDLSTLPIMQKHANSLIPQYVSLSGVFTVDTGIWTVPIMVDGNGTSWMSNPDDPNTFKQGLNNYDCARASLYSKKSNETFLLLFGGISYLTYTDGMFVPDEEIPFNNNVSTIKIDSSGNFTQYVMPDQYPVILSSFVNPGNELLFGAEARFIPAGVLPLFQNGVFSFDELGSSPLLLGYIVGGIQSTLSNTITMADSSSSPYIFEVYIQRR